MAKFGSSSTLACRPNVLQGLPGPPISQEPLRLQLRILSKREASGSRGRRLCCSASSNQQSPFEVLGIPAQGVTRKEIRTAYLQQMKTIHPDVSDLDDRAATMAATALNLAYEAALQSLDEGLCDQRSSRFVPQDEFDRTAGPASHLFVNPFACNADPLLWREVQQTAMAGASAGRFDQISGANDALRLRGVFAPEAALTFVTLEQLETLYSTLEMMEYTMDLEATAWFLDDMLVRARRANARQP
mmetsp:Transcript_3125/g.8888  ORF Transcript_3125/g.8888 Transcript_3125/m.8888 type:complete len:245 (+) Transcript_3125:517-1251(+)|eukprot:CAMPEP_0117668324 /NCGR_PEP_ID=MMETSP0804-20121206/11483_1 /TAXON_ID=1074897 /ORGANISM="Tetraselmis astigmatica, Strain CCMP880" /LENGTH=244 /DNA_ID=CAMNT_0005476197 /DNA_START=444 /DNA_END=1178 /DNA_ORIENTATION=+